METTEGFEMHMRDVLHGADDQAAGFTAAQVIAKGRSRRRARTAAASGVALVAAGAVAVVPSVLTGGPSRHGGQGSGVSAAGTVPVPAVTSVPTSTTHPAPASSPASSPVSSPSPSARVVPTGTLQIGDGYSLVLTKDSLTLQGHGGASGPNYTDNGNQPSGTIGIQGDGRAVAGLYIGDGVAATGSFKVAGKVYPMQVVTLAGHPGWSVAYAVLPSAPTWGETATISVSDAGGHVLASFTDPARH